MVSKEGLPRQVSCVYTYCICRNEVVEREGEGEERKRGREEERNGRWGSTEVDITTAKVGMYNQANVNAREMREKQGFKRRVWG